MELDISIVIPTYNRKKLLKRTLNSLFKQTYPRDKYEILVIDDGSTDETSEMIKELMRTHPELKYLRQRNRGPASARNQGIKKAKGRIVAFIDDDCIANRNWLMQIMNSFTDDSILGVEGKTETIKNEITPFTHYVLNERGGLYPSCNIAYRADILKDVKGFDGDYPYQWCEDVDLAFAVLNHGKITFNPKVLITHPPRKRSFVSLIKKMKFYKSEWRLYNKYPKKCRDYGKVHPIIAVYYSVFLIMLFSQIRNNIRFVSKNPLLFVKFVIALILQRAYLLLLLPYFLISNTNLITKKK